MELCRTVIRKSSTRVCAGGLDIQNFDKNSRFAMLVISI